jgi:hypothetical protein
VLLVVAAFVAGTVAIPRLVGGTAYTVTSARCASGHADRHPTSRPVALGIAT